MQQFIILDKRQRSHSVFFHRPINRTPPLTLNRPKNTDQQKAIEEQEEYKVNLEAVGSWNLRLEQTN
jgi:hypothetical protein